MKMHVLMRRIFSILIFSPCFLSSIYPYSVIPKKTYRYHNAHFCLTSLWWKLSNITLNLVILHLQLVYLFFQLAFRKRVFPCSNVHFYTRGSIRRKLHFYGIHVDSTEITESAKNCALRLKSITCLPLESLLLVLTLILMKTRTNPQNRRKLLGFGSFSFFLFETLKILLKYVKQRIMNVWEAMFFWGALVNLSQNLCFISCTLVQNSYVLKLGELHSLRKITWQRVETNTLEVVLVMLVIALAK